MPINIVKVYEILQRKATIIMAFDSRGITDVVKDVGVGIFNRTIGRLRGAGGGIRGPADRFDDLMVDGADSISANVWTIFYMKDNLADQKNMQFAVSNETGSTSDIEFGFMRLV